jgi:gliding motility-associated-like protein
MNGSSETVSPGSTTVYTVNVTDANGCTTTSQNVSVNVNPLPLVQFAPSITDGCSPVCVGFTNQTSNVSSNTWMFGDAQTSQSVNPFHCYVIPGTYDVTLYVTDNNGCTDSLIANNLISVFPWAVADFSASPQPTDVNHGTIFFEDMSTGATTWFWNFGDAMNSTSTIQNPNFNYTEHGSYTVTLIANNIYGCADTVIHEIKIDEPFSVYVPNAFTPNGDGLNEVLYVTGVGIDPSRFEMIIYDRWGLEVFHSKDLDFGWDGRGKSGGEVLPTGVYVWMIETHANVNSVIHRYYGKVNLIK